MVKINSSIAPNNSNDSDKGKSYSNGILGISLGYPLFNNHMSQVIDILDTQVTNTLLVIGDALYRHNYQWYYGVSEKRALEITNSKGNKIFNKIRERLNKPHNSNFTLCKWSDLLNESSFNDYLNQVKKAIEEEPKLNNMFLTCANSFVQKRKQLGTIVLNEKKATDLSFSFLMEEVAMFAMLANKGWNNDVYPGKVLPIFKLINENKFAHLPNSLYKIRYVGSEVFKSLV